VRRTRQKDQFLQHLQYVRCCWESAVVTRLVEGIVAVPSTEAAMTAAGVQLTTRLHRLRQFSELLLLCCLPQADTYASFPCCCSALAQQVHTTAASLLLLLLCDVCCASLTPHAAESGCVQASSACRKQLRSQGYCCGLVQSPAASCATRSAAYNTNQPVMLQSSILLLRRSAAWQSGFTGRMVTTLVVSIQQVVLQRTKPLTHMSSSSYLGSCLCVSSYAAPCRSMFKSMGAFRTVLVRFMRFCTGAK
jgi:hypothetical protein